MASCNRTLAVLVCVAGIVPAGCTTSALRGVGAPPRQAEPVALAVAPEPAFPAAAGSVPVRQQLPATPAIEPVALAPAAVPPAPAMATSRTEAVAQIRDKAEAMPNVRPNVFAPVPPAPDRMSAEEAERSRAELAAAVERNRALAGSGNADAKAAEAKRLRDRARNHYKDALKQIEN